MKFTLHFITPADGKISRKTQTGKFLLAYFLFLCALLSVNPASAQTCFSTDYVRGCAPLKVTTKNCSATTDPGLILYSFSTGAAPQLAKEFTYTEPGTYYITQYINTGTSAGAKSDGTYRIDVYKPEPIDFEVIFCSGNTISLEIKHKVFPQYEIDFGDGSIEVIKLGDKVSHTYSSNTPKTIQVRGYLQNAPTTCGQSIRTITPMMVMDRAVFQQLKLISPSQAELRYSLNSGISYKLVEFMQNGTVTRTIDLPTGSTSYTLNGLDADFNNYLYRIDAFDPCANRTVGSGQTVGTFNLKATPIAGQNIISWNTPMYFGFQSYTLYRNDQVLKVITDGATTGYADTDIKCNQRYCYRLEVNLHEGNSKSISAEKCVVVSAMSNPVAVNSLQASVNNESIELNWKNPPGTNIARVTLMRSKNGGDFQEISIPPAPPYRDMSADAKGAAYCYKLTYIDDCGNRAPVSNTTCSVRLKGNITETEVQLSWQSNQQRPVYILQRLDRNNNVISGQGIADTTFTDLKENFGTQLVRYRVAVSEAGGMNYSNIISVRIPAVLISPNAFSPNADGLNDEFRVKGTFIGDYRITVFNRWGTAVYSSDQISEGWDGNVEGKEAPEGEYAYLIEARDTLGRAVIQRGMLMLVR